MRKSFFVKKKIAENENMAGKNNVDTIQLPIIQYYMPLYKDKDI